MGEQLELEGPEEGEWEVGRRTVKHTQNPKVPSEREVQEHFASGQLAYRSWCHHCVRGRGPEADHRRKHEEAENGIPENHLDYCFPGDETEERFTVLVGLERYSRMKKAVVVPRKSSTGSYAAKMIMGLTRSVARG
jgi:hypothetical protein